MCAPAGLTGTAFLRSDELPAKAALGYLFDDGTAPTCCTCPSAVTGDGGVYFCVDDLRTFWQAFLSGRIVGPELVQTMITPRFEAPEEGLRYGLGCWLHASGPAVLIEGYDAGVSMRSIHDPASRRAGPRRRCWPTPPRVPGVWPASC